jgi:hypothetical protein
MPGAEMNQALKILTAIPYLLAPALYWIPIILGKLNSGRIWYEPFTGRIQDIRPYKPRAYRPGILESIVYDYAKETATDSIQSAAIIIDNDPGYYHFPDRPDNGEVENHSPYFQDVRREYR